jgi:glycine cleavage system regulatory protein
MATIVDRFEDLGNVTELYHHNIRNLAAYLTACGFEKSKYVNYKYSRVYVDHKNQRAVEVYIEAIDDRNDIVERIEFLKDVKGI